MSYLDQIYQLGLRPLLFAADPELAHKWAIALCQAVSNLPSLQTLVRSACVFEQPRLGQKLWGLEFPNPIGLAAGFDKDAIAVGAWPSFGFGFAEVGTITAQAQPGNPTPRLFRLPGDRAVLNRMGFNNRGAAATAAYLREYLNKHQVGIPIGINIGKSKITPLEEAKNDYLHSFKLLKDLGDYFVVNVSSPNTPGLRDLQATVQLREILTTLQDENSQGKPILVKIAPDLADEDICEVVDVLVSHRVAGIIATNTTIARQNLMTQVLPATGKPVAEEAGGISGKPLKARSTQVIELIWRQTNGKLPIIGVGGIFDAEDAWEKIVAGASLLQIYTGLIYEGPFIVRQILQGLVNKLDELGLENIDRAIGLKHR